MEIIHIFFLIVVFFLLIFSGFFSGSETALTSVSKAKIHQLSKSGDKRALLIKKLQDKLPSTITTILIANQMTNHITTTIITWIIVDVLGESFVPLISSLFGLVLIVYAEIVPKVVAISNANKYCTAVAEILSKVVKVMHPIANLLEFCARQSLKLLHFDHNQKPHNSDEEELKGAIDLHITGKDEKQEKQMLNSILQLSDVEVSEVMIHRGQLVTVNASQNLSTIKKTILNCPYSRIPVWKKTPENIIGILHTKTLLKKLTSTEKFRLEDICVKPWFIPETTRLLHQLQAFRNKREHFALVVDEYGDLQGGITLEDILEEIVGEIVDEYDELNDDINIQQDGSIIVKGMVSLRELNRNFEWTLPEDEDFSTIAGLVMSITKNIPNKGAIITWHGLRIEILKCSKTSINLIKLSRIIQ